MQNKKILMQLLEEQSMDSIDIKVIKLTQPKGEFFIGKISAKILVDIAFSDVRRIKAEQRDVEKYLGIQRPLDKVRVSKIRQYIQSPDASFPTGIVLAINPNCAEYDPNTSILSLNEYNADFLEDTIPVDKIAKVLDGQHRIAAFMNDQGNYDFTLEIEDFDLNIVIFIGLDIDEQANIFATINLAQTKVNKSLVYDLEGLSKTRSPFRTAHKIAVALDSADQDSPLHQRIKRLGVKTKDRENSEPLTQAAFVESLLKLISPDPFQDRTDVMKGKKLKRLDSELSKKYPFRNLFIDEKDNDIAIIIYNYFKSVEKTWPQSWNDLNAIGNILPKSNAFKAFMRYLRILYINIVGENIGRIVTVEEFVNHFQSYSVKDQDFTSGNFLPGSGGEASFYKILTRQLEITDLKNKSTSTNKS